MAREEDDVEFLPHEPRAESDSSVPVDAGAPHARDDAVDELDTGPRRTLGRRARVLLGVALVVVAAAAAVTAVARHHSSSHHPSSRQAGGVHITVSGTPPVLNPPPPPGGHSPTIEVVPVTPVSCGPGEACGGDPSLPFAVTSAIVEHVPDGALLSSETHRHGAQLVSRRIDLESATDGEVVITVAAAHSSPPTSTESGDDGKGTYARGRIGNFIISVRASVDAPSHAGHPSPLQQALLDLVRDPRLITAR